MTEELKRPLERMLEPLLEVPMDDMRKAGVPDYILERAERSNEKVRALVARMDDAYEHNKPLLLSTEELFQVYVVIGAAFGMVIAEKRHVDAVEERVAEATSNAGVMCWLLARLTQGADVHVTKEDSRELDDDSQWAVEAESFEQEDGGFVYRFRRILKHEPPHTVQ